jgi:hypothetical protein
MSVINTGNKIGQGIAFVRMIITIILAMSCCSSGMFLVTTPEKHSGRISGKVKTVNCSFTRSAKNRIERRCTVTYTYTVGGVEYSGSQNKQFNLEPKVGGTIDISYDPTNPEDSTLNKGNPKVVGFGLMSCACLMVVIAYLLYYATTSVKGAGTFLAGATAYNLVTD